MIGLRPSEAALFSGWKQSQKHLITQYVTICPQDRSWQPGPVDRNRP
jgi:hypothetical protein